jgi:diguanylate cyclase (GGDEF)-like protein
LLEKARRGGANEYDTEHGSKLFFERRVTGTPWSLVISAEQSRLFALLDGHRSWVLWSLFGAFCAISITAAFLLLRLRSVSKVQAHLARFDRLTNLPNRLQLEEHLTRLVSDATRNNRPLSVFIVDIDHFKRVNDTHGHRVGDEVLRTLAARMAKALRAEDMIGRWGGEEFLALLPNTSAEGACTVADRVRATAGSSPVVASNGHELHVTVSIGCATREGTADAEYIQRADEALYSAKHLGRNRVVSSAPPRARQDGDAHSLAHGA